MTSWEQLLNNLHKKESLARLSGGAQRQELEKKKGKLLCRERIDALVDPGSFNEINMLAETQTFEFGMQDKKVLGDGVVTGLATVDRRQVVVFAQDVTVFGGAAGRAHGEKINYMLRLARKIGVPVIGLYESGGGRLQDGMQNESGYGRMFYENTRCSGVVPQIAAIMGDCTGGGVYSPALMDFIIQVEKTAHLFITGPAVIKEVMTEEVTFEQLGGTGIHSQESGVTHLVAKSDADCIQIIKKLLSYLPQNNKEKSPLNEGKDDPLRSNEILTTIVSPDSSKVYDMRLVIREIMDMREFFEIQQSYAKNMIIGFGRLDGQSVGLIANQPLSLCGTIDINAADKAARFIRFCDCFNIPLVILTDVPGYLPGTDQEKKGIIRHGAKMLYAFSEASVPKISCVIRKSYGGAIPAMCCHETGADLYLAWPTAEFAMLGTKAAMAILYKKEIAEAKDPDKLREEKAREYEEYTTSPYAAASKQYVDAVINPADTRKWLIRGLRWYQNKNSEEEQIWKKHGNIPL